MPWQLYPGSGSRRNNESGINKCVGLVNAIKQPVGPNKDAQYWQFL